MDEPKSLVHEQSSKTVGLSIVMMTLGVIITIILVWIGRVILLLLFASVVVAILLCSIVDFVQSKLKFKRGVALAMILFSTAVIVFFTVWLVGPNIVDQFASLQSDLPNAARQLVDRVKVYAWGRWMLGQWTDYSQLSGSLTYALTRIGGIVLSAATLLAGLVIVGFLSLYIAAEPDVYFKGLLRAIPLDRRAIVMTCSSNAVSMLRRWLLAQMLSMAAVGLLVFLGLWLLGVPLAGTLGVIAALLTFIPNLGPLLSVAPAALLAFAMSPMKGLLAVALFAGVHFLEGNMITPLIQRQMVRLPPALTLIVQLLLAVIAGPLGVALAAPLTVATLGILHVLLPEEGSSTNPPRKLPSLDA